MIAITPEKLGTWAALLQKKLHNANGRSYAVWLVPAKSKSMRYINDPLNVLSEIPRAAGKAIDTRTANTIF